MVFHGNHPQVLMITIKAYKSQVNTTLERPNTKEVMIITRYDGLQVVAVVVVVAAEAYKK